MKKLTTQSKLMIAKKITNVVVTYGTGIIVTGAVINNAAPKNLPQKVAVVIAGTVIAMAAREKIGAYTDAKFDWFVDEAKNLLTKNEALTEETPVEA